MIVALVQADVIIPAWVQLVTGKDLVHACGEPLVPVTDSFGQWTCLRCLLSGWPVTGRSL